MLLKTSSKVQWPLWAQASSLGVSGSLFAVLPSGLPDDCSVKRVELHTQESGPFPARPSSVSLAAFLQAMCILKTNFVVY